MIGAYTGTKESMANFVGGRKTQKASQGGDRKPGFERLKKFIEKASRASGQTKPPGMEG